MPMTKRAFRKLSAAAGTGRVALLVLIAAGAGASEQEVGAVLDGFLRAFENGDIESMEAAFAEDALTFPRSIMATDLDMDIDVRDYRRVTGIDPQMRALIDRLKAEGRTPPYLSLDPQDLDIRVYGDAAVATFHLTGARLGRRTFVLAKLDGEWKIVHLHASNVVGSE